MTNDRSSKSADRRMKVVGVAGITLALGTLLATAVLTCSLLLQAGPLAGAAIDDQDALRSTPGEAGRYNDLWIDVVTTWAWGTLTGVALVALGIWAVTVPSSRRMGTLALAIAGSAPCITAVLAVSSLHIGAGSAVL